MNKTLLVARQEFKVTALNKAFVAITLIGPVLILAISVLPGFLATSGAASAGSVLALVGGGEGERRAFADSLSRIKVELRPVRDEAEAKAGLLGGSWAAALVLAPGWEDAASVALYAKTGTDAVLYGAVGSTLDGLAREKRIAASGMDPALVRRLLAGPELSVRRLALDKSESERSQGDYIGILLTVITFVMLVYMTVLLYGQLIGRSVLQEKTAKTVEIMLSSVSSRELLVGKILGPGLAGLIQYGFWVVMTLGGTAILGPRLGVALPTVISPANLAWLIVFFLGAYFLYASAYAALGAAAEDEQHLSQLAWPLLIFLIFPMVLINSFVMNPDSTLPVILSFFPLTSPIVMLIRVLVSPPAWWELALSVTILAVSIVGMALLAGKVFRVGILLTGKRKNLGEILRWAALP